MKKPEELYYTIRSLDPHELRYFRLFSQRHVIGEENSYLRLFDLILEHEDMTDSKLVSEHKIKNLPRSKQYLLSLLHKALFQYHDNETWQAEVKRFTRMAEIFLDKGEFALAKENAERATKIAEEYLLGAELLRCNDLQYQLRNRGGDTGLMKDYPHSAIDDIHTAKQLSEIIHARVLLEKIKKIDKENGASQKTETGDNYENIFKEINYEAKNISENAEAEILLKTALMFYYYNHSKHEEFFLLCQEVLAIYKKNPGLIKKDEYRYLGSLQNIIICSVRTNRKKEFVLYANEFKNYPTKSRSLLYYIFVRFSNASVYRFVEHKDFSGITNFLPYLNEGLKKFDQFNPVALSSLYYSTCICLIQIKNYKEALRWTNKIIGGKEFLFNTAIFRPAMVINCIANFELEEFDLLISNLKSFERLNEKKKEKEKYETIFFKELLKIVNTKNKVKQKEFFSNLKTSLENELIKNKQTIIMYGFDLIEWCGQQANKL